MGLWARIKSRVRREHFQPTWLGLVVNPVFIVRNGLFEAIKQHAPEVKGKILDFGCGSKPYENLFIHSDSYIGCDIVVSGHDHRDSKIDCFFDGRILPFHGAAFDAVVSFEVFEHIFNLPDLLGEINRVTKPGGFLLISVPFIWAEHEIPYDFARYTSYGVSHLLKQAGYEVVGLNKTSSYFLAVFQLLIAYLYQYLAPKNRLIYVFQILVIFPLMLLAHLLNAILPKRYDLFCGCVVLARKVDIGNERQKDSIG